LALSWLKRKLSLAWNVLLLLAQEIIIAIFYGLRIFFQYLIAALLLVWAVNLLQENYLTIWAVLPSGAIRNAPYKWVWPNLFYVFVLFQVFLVGRFIINVVRGDDHGHSENIFIRYVAFKFTAPPERNRKWHSLDSASRDRLKRCRKIIALTVAISIDSWLLLVGFADPRAEPLYTIGRDLHLFKNSVSEQDPFSLLLFVIDIFLKGALFDFLEIFKPPFSQLRVNEENLAFKLVCFAYKFSVSGVESNYSWIRQFIG